MTLSKAAMRKGWKAAYEDTPGGLYWRRRSEYNSLQYLFAEVIDMDDACGRDNEGQPQFVWEAYLVDLSILSPEEMTRAVESGIGVGTLAEIHDKHGKQAYLDAIAEACFQYGTRGPLDSGSCSRFEWGRARAIAAADDAASTEDRLADRLDRTVNRIGSTARDFMSGDALAGLHRNTEKVQRGEEIGIHSAITLRMYSAAGGRTLGGTVETDLAAAGAELKRRENDG